ncbi:MAG: pentapeptide repeat-containing protein [Aureliella sp.]
MSQHPFRHLLRRTSLRSTITGTTLTGTTLAGTTITGTTLTRTTIARTTLTRTTLTGTTLTRTTIARTTIARTTIARATTGVFGVMRRMGRGELVFRQLAILVLVELSQRGGGLLELLSRDHMVAVGIERFDDRAGRRWWWRWRRGRVMRSVWVRARRRRHARSAFRPALGASMLPWSPRIARLGITPWAARRLSHHDTAADRQDA